MTPTIRRAASVPPVSEAFDVKPGLCDRLGSPGQPPFTRGIHPDGYTKRSWTIRQLAGFGTPADTNQRYRLLLSEGATGINAVFDYPSLRAFDSDNPRCIHDVGRGGVAVDVAHDFDLLFWGIPLATTSVSLVSSQPIGAVPHMAMFIRAAKNQGAEVSQLRGTSQNDFLMETCITIGPEVLPPAASFRLECDLAEHCIAHLPHWNPVSIAAYNYREAGANPQLEVALAIAHGHSVIEELIKRGVGPDEAAKAVTFFFSAGSSLLEEVAKFRAARRVWYRTATGLGCSDQAARLRFHAQTSGISFQAETPLLNIARGALQGLAAVLGGAQSLHINGYDEPFAIPTEAAARIALKTQGLIANEAGLTKTVDPLGGSYTVEILTDRLDEEITDLATFILNAGGPVELTSSGWVHREVSRTAYEAAVELEQTPASCRDGSPELAEVETFDLPAGILEAQLSQLFQARKRRNPDVVSVSLEGLEDAAHQHCNVMPATIAAVDGGATVGEIGRSFRRSLGVWTVPIG